MTHIVLADNQALLRSGLRLILERQPDMTVVGEAQNGSEAMALALQPEQLWHWLHPAALPFQTTTEITPLADTISQPRAIEAIAASAWA